MFFLFTLHGLFYILLKKHRKGFYFFMKKQKRSILFFLLIAFFAVNLPMAYIGQNNIVEITEYEIKSSKIDSPVTLVQISDLHEKSFGKDNSRLFDTVESLNPDLICITGDMIYHSYTDSLNTAYIENVARRCSGLAPSFFVTGNHERFWADEVKKLFSKNGVAVLHGNVIPLIVGTTSLNIGGTDDATVDPGSIEKLRFPDSRHFNVLLAHTPDPFRGTYDQKKADLVLSGHTHGGQLRLPGGKALFSPSGEWLPEYSDGLYTSGSTTMILSKGLGSSVVPVRLFAQPEIVLVRLLPADS